jgi:hypothetical protein
MGVFLGTHRMPLQGAGGPINIMRIFSKNDMFGISRAYSFDTKKDAFKYMQAFLIEDYPLCKIVEIESSGQYVDVIDLIKSGYTQYTHDMVDALPMDNETIH